MTKQFSAEDFAHLRQLVSFMGAETADEQDTWKGRALVTVAMLHDTFPQLDDNTLAGFCAAITYLLGEISFAKVAEAGRMLNVIYMSYSLATAHLLGMYDAGDASKVKAPDPEQGRQEEYWGQYL